MGFLGGLAKFGSGLTKTGSIGMGIGRSIFSSSGLFTISLILVIIIGINPLILGLNLVVEGMKILSGTSLVNSILKGTFEPGNPVFYIYLTVFAISFIMIIYKLIKNSLGDLTFDKDISSKQTRTMSTSKLKWILIWIVVFLTVPFVAGIMYFIISLFANLFGIQQAVNVVSVKFTITDFKDSINSISIQSNTLLNQINNFYDIIFPKNIESSAIPKELLNLGITKESWHLFLTNLKSNEIAQQLKTSLDVVIVKLNSFNNQLSTFLSNASQNSTAEQFKTIYDSVKSSIENINQTIKNILPILNNMPEAITSIINQISSLNDPIHKPLIDNIGSIFNIISNFQTGLNNQFQNLINTFGESKLHSLAIYGLDFNDSNNNDNSVNNFDLFRLDPLVLSTCKAVYGFNVYSWQVSPSGFVYFFQGGIHRMVSIIAGTWGIFYVFKTFWSLLITLGMRLFDFLAMICIGNFATSNGVSDGGEKFAAWLKTFVGKLLTVFIISFSLSLFSIVIFLIHEFTWNIANNFSLQIVITIVNVAIIIATCNGMLELIGWLSQFLQFDGKVTNGRAMRNRGSFNTDISKGAQNMIDNRRQKKINQQKQIEDDYFKNSMLESMGKAPVSSLRPEPKSKKMKDSKDSNNPISKEG